MRRRILLPLFLLMVVIGAVAAWQVLRGTAQRETPTPPPPAANGPATPAPTEAQEVTIYLAQEMPEYEFALAPVTRQVPPGTAPARAALDALAAGPTAEEKARGMLATLPTGTKVLNVTVEGGVAYANFSRELEENFNGGAEWEEIVLYSIVNTLTAVEGVNGVRIRMEGAPLESIGGHLAADELLRRNPDLVARGKGQ